MHYFNVFCIISSAGAQGLDQMALIAKTRRKPEIGEISEISSCWVYVVSPAEETFWTEFHVIIIIILTERVTCIVLPCTRGSSLTLEKHSCPWLLVDNMLMDIGFYFEMI